MTSVDYSITMLVFLLCYTLMTFYCWQWHRRLPYCRNFYGRVSMTKFWMTNIMRYERIGARHEKLCSKITTMDGRELECVDEIRYLGVYILRAKLPFYPAANSIFGKIGRIAYEEVTSQITVVKSKCVPSRCYCMGSKTSFTANDKCHKS